MHFTVNGVKYQESLLSLKHVPWEHLIVVVDLCMLMHCRLYNPAGCPISQRYVGAMGAVHRSRGMVNTHKQHKFKFDEWSELSQKDPEAFEELRQKTIDEFIDGVAVEKQQRLRCLQWKIDRVREQNTTPLAACVAISDMMWDSLERLHKIYYDYENITSMKDGKRVLTPLPTASVVPFQTRTSQ